MLVIQRAVLVVISILLMMQPFWNGLFTISYIIASIWSSSSSSIQNQKHKIDRSLAVTPPSLFGKRYPKLAKTVVPNVARVVRPEKRAPLPIMQSLLLADYSRLFASSQNQGGNR